MKWRVARKSKISRDWRSYYVGKLRRISAKSTWYPLRGGLGRLVQADGDCLWARHGSFRQLKLAQYRVARFPEILALAAQKYSGVLFVLSDPAKFNYRVIGPISRGDLEMQEYSFGSGGRHNGIPAQYQSDDDNTRSSDQYPPSNASKLFPQIAHGVSMSIHDIAGKFRKSLRKRTGATFTFPQLQQMAQHGVLHLITQIEAEELCPAVHLPTSSETIGLTTVAVRNPVTSGKLRRPANDLSYIGALTAEA